MISYLDRFVGSQHVKSPLDVMRLFHGLTVGQQHHLNRALRALLNYHEALGMEKSWLDTLRRAIPKDKIGIDLHVPEPEDVVQSLRVISGAPMKYRALWNLCLDGGIWLVDAIGILEGFSEHRLMPVNDFCRYEVGAFRKSKQAYYAYFMPSTLAMIQEAAGVKIEERRASS